MTLSQEEFLRRFLEHVLPKGFPRIRYFGFLANRRRAELLLEPPRETAGAAEAQRRKIDQFRPAHP
jgi:hypothetical protein